MKVIRTIEELRKIRCLHVGDSIGFVPTMGAFHEGHLSLMEASKTENDKTIVSLFVNPLQFGPNEDLDEYPRHEDADIEQLKNKEIDYLFIPSVKEMYPNQTMIQINASARTNVLCGEKRPGHFDGVLTVLTKLFHMVHPTHVYMGLKDAQQFAVVDLLIRDLNFPIELVGLPTIREDNGLAKSSRNEYLTVEEKDEASILYKSLLEVQDLLKQKSIANIDEIKEFITQEITEKTTGVVDYVSVLSYPDLSRIESIETRMIIAIAVFFNRTRLIDNLILTPEGDMISSIRRNYQC